MNIYKVHVVERERTGLLRTIPSCVYLVPLKLLMTLENSEGLPSIVWGQRFTSFWMSRKTFSLSLNNPCFFFYLFSHKNQEIPLGLINWVFKNIFGIFSLYLVMSNVTSECAQNVEKHAWSAEKKGKPGFTIQPVPANKNALGTSVRALSARWGLDLSKVNLLGRTTQKQ